MSSTKETQKETQTLEVPVEELRQALKTVKPALQEWQPSVRIACDGDSVNVETWQSDVAVRCSIEVPGPIFDVTVQHRDLAAALDGTSATEAMLSAVEATSPQLGTLEVGLGARTVEVSMTSARESWPELDFAPPDASPLLRSSFWQSSGFAELFRRVQTHASADETRPVLQGLLLDESNVVATDSFRLICLDLPAYDMDTELPLKDKVAVSARYLAMACKGETHISHKEKYVYVASEAARWRILKIDGQWPNWRQLVPDKNELMVRGLVDRVSLFEAARAFARVRALNTAMTLIPSDDDLGLEIMTSSGGKARERIAWSYEQKPEVKDPQPFGVNPEFLAQACKALEGEEIRLEAVSPLRPLTLTGQDGWVLLMPIRLNV